MDNNRTGARTMTFSEILADLANYDQHADWQHDGDFPITLDSGDVQWEIHQGWLTRSEGCYDQSCDIMPSSSVADTMRAMSAASAAFDRHLAQAMSDSMIGMLAERERGR